MNSPLAWEQTHRLSWHVVSRFVAIIEWFSWYCHAEVRMSVGVVLLFDCISASYVHVSVYATGCVRACVCWCTKMFCSAASVCLYMTLWLLVYTSCYAVFIPALCHSIIRARWIIIVASHVSSFLCLFIHLWLRAKIFLFYACHVLLKYWTADSGSWDQVPWAHEFSL